MSIARAERDLQRLRVDIQKLETQLTDMRQREVKIAHFLEMYHLYEGEDEATESTEPRRRGGGEPPPSVTTTVEILRDSGHPIPTRELVGLLAEKGVHIGGENPITNLSGALSKWKLLLKADRTRGWGLVEWGGAPEEDSPAPEASSDRAEWAAAEGERDAA